MDRDEQTTQAIEWSGFTTTVFNCWDQLFSFLLKALAATDNESQGPPEIDQRKFPDSLALQQFISTEDI